MPDSETNHTEESEPEYEQTARERLLSAIHTLSKPAKVSTLAEMADCSDQGARNILSDFEQLGVVEKVAEDPLKYDKNDAYFRFRRGQDLATTHSDAEIVSEIQSKWNHHREYQKEFSTPLPNSVNVEQIQDEYGDDGASQIRKWRNVYEKLQDYLEALEQKRETKLLLDNSLEFTGSQQGETAIATKTEVENALENYSDYKVFNKTKLDDKYTHIPNFQHGHLPAPLLFDMVSEFLEDKSAEEVQAYVTPESDQTKSRY